jgi:hypothetical protein
VEPIWNPDQVNKAVHQRTSTVLGSHDQASMSDRRIGDSTCSATSTSRRRPDQTLRLVSVCRVTGFVTAGDIAGPSAATGAWVGGLFGLLSGTALLFIPGSGPLIVLGPLATAAIGAAQGALSRPTLRACLQSNAALIALRPSGGIRRKVIYSTSQISHSPGLLRKQSTFSHQERVYSCCR